MKSKILKLLAVGLLTTTTASNAAIITYDFTVTGSSINHPYQDVQSSGFFSYDSSIAVPGGGLNATGVLTDLSFTWAGVTYDETTANTGSMKFDASGALGSIIFGSDCFVAGCSVTAGTSNWYVATGSNLFVYSTEGDVSNYNGSVSFALREASVPEPGTLALLGLGLGLVGMSYARRRRAA